jgi:hypothetical protein
MRAKITVPNLKYTSIHSSITAQFTLNSSATIKNKDKGRVNLTPLSRVLMGMVTAQFSKNTVHVHMHLSASIGHCMYLYLSTAVTTTI